MKSTQLFLLSFLPFTGFATADCCPQPTPSSELDCCHQSEPLPETVSCESMPRWYFEVKPGYYYFTDATMREHFENGGFTIRSEAGCKIWGPLIVWIDGGIFTKEGTAIGGPEKTHILLATITLGLKAIYYFNEVIAVYAGAGPRLFMMKMKNDSPYVPLEDNQLGIGGGFDGGFWILPFAKCNHFSKNLFLDFFADYSWKNLKTEEVESSSEDFDVDVSGLSAGVGLGIRF